MRLAAKTRNSVHCDLRPDNAKEILQLTQLILDHTSTDFDQQIQER
jgi:hypothetical protein